MTPIRLLSLPLLLALVVALGACGGSKKQESLADKFAAQAEQERAKQKPLAPTPAPTVETVTPSAAEADLKVAPKVPKGTGAKPTKLIVQDLIPGTGAAAKTGDSLTVDYVGVLFDTGLQFDSSWAKGRDPLTFKLGSDNVIEGWHEGLIGMKVGGRRKLIIPPDLAYGSQASGKIPANAALIFDVDLKKIG